MSLKFYCYPNCSTCRNAHKYLQEKGIDVEMIDIKKTPPTAKELEAYHKQSGLDLKKFFNTSGNSYRELGLKDTFHQHMEHELYDMLSQDGMLIKRPILVGDDFVLVGFKPEQYDEVL